MSQHMAYARMFIGGVSLALEIAAAIIILVAATRAFLTFARAFIERRPAETFATDLRRRFGISLLLGLDFAIGSDVLEVAVDPVMDTVLVVGLVVLVRTVLTLVLEYELSREEKKERKQRRKDGNEDGPEARGGRPGPTSA